MAVAKLDTIIMLSTLNEKDSSSSCENSSIYNLDTTIILNAVDDEDSSSSSKSASLCSITPSAKEGDGKKWPYFTITKDIKVVFLWSALACFWPFICWAPFHTNSRNIIPAGTSLLANNAFDAQLHMNRTTYCMNNRTINAGSFRAGVNTSTLESNSALMETSYYWSNNKVNITLVGFYEIAKCLGWTEYNVGCSIGRYSYFALKWNVPALIGIHRSTNFADFKWKSWMKKIIPVIVLQLSAYIWAYLTYGEGVGFMIIWMIIICMVYSRPFLWLLSVEHRISWRWSIVLYFWTNVSALITVFPGIGGQFVKWVRVFLPLILLFVDMTYTKIFERTFEEYQDNYNGQVWWASLYIYIVEFARFSCFLSLYLDSKDGTVAIWEVLFNALFSILSEIWIHSGVHEPVAQYLDNRFGFLNLAYKFPKLRMCFNSIRAIIEWVVPSVQLVGIYLIDWSRDYVPVIDDDHLNQLYFFSSYRIIDIIWESVLVYYSVEVISKIFCWLTANMIDYHQISVISMLGWSSILSWCVSIIILQDVWYSNFFWSIRDT